MLHSPSSHPIAVAPLQVPTSLDADLTRAALELSQWRARLSFQDLQACAVYPRDADRSFVRLPSQVGCEVWLICWPPGSRAPLHDHGSASAVATMLSGELREWLQPADAACYERTWRGPTPIEIPLNVRHEVWNDSDHTAYSLHVYTPKLASMTFYERLGDGELRAVRREEAHQW